MSKTRLLSLSVVLFVAAITAVACSNGRVSSAEACASAADYHECLWDRQTFRPDHPCRLLRIAEIEVVVGEPLHSIPGYSDQEHFCFFGYHSSDITYTYTTDPGAQDRFSTATGSLSDQVEGLGTHALWDPRARTLHVSTEKGYFSIEIPAIKNARDIAIALTKLALKRV